MMEQKVKIRKGNHHVSSMDCVINALLNIVLMIVGEKRVMLLNMKVKYF